jgi:hypothetical protein
MKKKTSRRTWYEQSLRFTALTQSAKNDEGPLIRLSLQRLQPPRVEQRSRGEILQAQALAEYFWEHLTVEVGEVLVFYDKKPTLNPDTGKYLAPENARRAIVTVDRFEYDQPKTYTPLRKGVAYVLDMGGLMQEEAGLISN